MVIFFLLLLLATGVAKAATFGVTTPGQQTLTNRFLPYAGSGTQLIGNSPAWRDSAGVLGINNYLEGLETLTPAAAVNLNFSTWRTKRITLNQNTIFTAINIPSASTNVQTMLLEVIGDGAFTVSFANVTWQTPEITTPEAGVVTLYALRGDNGAVKGYTQAVAASGVTTINPTDGYLPYRSNATTFADSPWYQISTNKLGFNGTGPVLTLYATQIGFGTNSLQSITTGTDNTAFGHGALRSVTGGNDNVAVGEFALRDTLIGDLNIAVGKLALAVSTNSDYSTSIGTAALGTVETGNGNTAVGYRAGNPVSNALRTGSNNTYLGYFAGNSTSDSDVNSIVIGANARSAGSNTATIGTNGVTVLWLNGTVGWFRGSGTPEGAVAAPVGSFFSREDGGAGTSLYVKESGTGNTGWVAAAGGGSPLWASSSGNLSPSPAVDVVSIQSQSADNATNVALIVDSAVPWTVGSLFQAQNNGTNQLSILPNGSVHIGPGTTAYWGIGNEAVVQYHDVVAGDSNGGGFYSEVVNGLDDDSFVSITTTTVPTYSQLKLEATSTNRTDRITLITYPDSATRLQITRDGTVGVTLEPGGTGVTPFEFNATTTHSSGDLLTLANNSTNKVVADYLGNVTANAFIAATTNMVGALANKVTGAASSTDNDLMTFSSTSGKLAKVSTSAGTLGDASSTFYDLLFSLSAGSPTLTATNGLILVGGSANLAVTNATAKLTLGSWNEAVSGTSLTFFPTGSSAMLSILTTGVRIKNTGILDFGAAADSISRENTGVFQFGTDAAAPTDMLLKADDGLGTDKAGAAGGLAAGRATGTGRPGDLTLQTGTTSTASAATQNALTTRFQAVSKAVDLTESTATAFQKFTLATNNYAGMEIVATVRASDAAFAMQSLTSKLLIDAVNVGGTNVVTITQTDNTLAQIPTGGTLTCTYDTLNEGSNVFSIRANAASSLTQTALRVKWVITALNSSDAITVTPQ